MDEKRKVSGVSRAARGLFFLCVACLLLPWFTYGPEMSPCRGVAFLVELFAPMAVAALFLFRERGHRAWAMLCEVGALASLAIVISAIGRWQVIGNIKNGLDWAGGVDTATAWYWLSLGLYLALAVVIQPLVLQTMRAEGHDIRQKGSGTDGTQ